MSLSQQKTVFGSYAKDYQKYRRYYLPELYSLLFRIAKKQYPGKKLSVLDIGCGTGKSTEPLLKIGKVYGTDADPRMLKEARSHAKALKLPITYIEAQAEDLPFEKSTFDIITVATAFHWFATLKTLREMKRILKPGGLIFVYWPMESKNNPPTIGRDLYKKFVWKAVPRKLRDIAYIKALFLKSRLLGVKTTKLPFENKFTAEQYVGGLKTSSMYALMSLSQKKDFSKDMFEAFKREVSGKYHRIKSEMLICYGFKKS